MIALVVWFTCFGLGNKFLGEFILHKVTIWVKRVRVPSQCPTMSPLLFIHFRGYATLGTATICQTRLCLYSFVHFQAGSCRYSPMDPQGVPVDMFKNLSVFRKSNLEMLQKIFETLSFMKAWRPVSSHCALQKNKRCSSRIGEKPMEKQGDAVGPAGGVFVQGRFVHPTPADPLWSPQK